MSMYQVMSPGIDIYGIEVKPVKSKRELPQELAERLALPEEALPLALEALDDDLMARRLSPGGSADLLALALFLRAAAPETWL